MSTRWYLHCADDGGETDDGIQGAGDSGARTLAELADLGPHLAALAATDTHDHVELGHINPDAAEALRWLRWHGTHRLTVVSEYGDHYVTGEVAIDG